MAKTKGQKKAILKNLNEKMAKAKSIVFASFNALGVKENEELRRQLRAENGEYAVVKKTLLGLAFKENNIIDVKMEDKTGGLAAVFGYGDEIMPAKVVDKFRKGREDKISFLGAILDNKFVSGEDVYALAKLPGKQELLAKVVGTINAPVFGFVNALAGNIRNLVYALKAIEEKK